MGLDAHFDNDMKFKLTEFDNISGIQFIYLSIYLSIY